MPNHCENHLIVMGDEKEVKRFHEAITKGENREQHSEFSILDNLLPTPKELHETLRGFCPMGSEDEAKQKLQQEENIKKFGFADWYDWSCANYGSKWTDFDGRFGMVTDNEINASFTSAWSPIDEGIRNVSKQFPTLGFVLTYHEGGMAFCGGYAIRNGEYITKIEGEYPTMTKEQSENEEYDEFYEKVCAVVDEIEVQCRKALSEVSVS